jgi:hypothetical protein
MELVNLIENEFNAFLDNTRYTYQSLEDYIDKSTSKNNKRLKNEIKKITQNISKAVKEYKKAKNNGKFDFTIEDFTKLDKSFTLLQNNLPDNDLTLDISNAIIETFDKLPISRLYQKIKKNMPITAALGVAGVVASHLLKTPIAFAVYGAVTACSIYEIFSKKESIPRKVVGNLGLLFGASALSQTTSPSTNNMLEAFRTATFLSHIPAMYLSYFVVQYANLKRKFNIKSDALKSNRVNFDHFLKTGIVISEAKKNLKYVENVCESNNVNINVYQDQIDKFEHILGDYIIGKATYQDVVNAKIKYIHPEKNEKVQLLQQKDYDFKKDGYSKEEYKEMKQKQEQETKKRKKKNKRNKKKYKTNIVEVNSNNESNESNIQVCFSDTLKKLYFKNSQLAGYGAVSIMDTTRQKIESNPAETVIRNNGTWATIHKNMKEKHNLDQNETLFKTSPYGSLRVIYTKNKNSDNQIQINILEVLTHRQYDLLMKK